MDEFEPIRRAMHPAVETDPDAEARAWARVQAKIDRVERDPGQPRGPQGGRRAIAVVAAVLGLALLLSVVPALLPDEVAPPRAAKALLAELATTAWVQPALVAAPGEYIYDHRRERRLESGMDIESGITWRSLVEVDTEQWLATDGSGRILRRFGEVEFVSPQDERLWIEAGRPPTSDGAVQDELLEPGAADVLDLSTLPTEPRSLLATIEERQIVGGPPGDVQTFDIIVQLLADPGASPALRAALFEAAGLLDGVEATGERLDPMGREGLGLALEDRRERIEIIVDPDDARLLSALETHGARELETWTAYIATGITTSVTERPTAPQ